jgi:ribosomal protein S18 acetylase RimI-like enzyme
MTTKPGVTFAHHDASSAEQVVESVIVPIYEATHADVIHDPFYGADRFVERARGYMKAPGFEIVTAEVDGKPVGLALGYALPVSARWWQGLTTPVEPELIAETGRRTFALCELMVHPDWQRHGIAHAVHDELLHHRPEERATLLVREDNTAAQAAYAKWGWTKLGKLKPYPDSPNYDALVLSLRQHR